MNHKGKTINGLLTKLKQNPKTFASQSPGFSISVWHHFLLLYWNLMTDLDFYLTPRREIWVSFFSVAKNVLYCLEHLLAKLPPFSISWPTSFLTHFRHVFSGKSPRLYSNTRGGVAVPAPSSHSHTNFLLSLSIVTILFCWLLSHGMT